MFDLLDLDEQQEAVQTLRPLIADNFAGGGGASTAIEMALGRSPDVAINHDPVALSMHKANHPDTLHLTNSVYAIDPASLVKRGQPVGLAWFSPDCKHHSNAKGGKPLDANIRDLAWVVVHWAERVKPWVIILENVQEFEGWCPLDENGKPAKDLKGQTFKKWVKRLRQLGYEVDWKVISASDHDTPTIRKRLYLIARCDGQPILWPEATTGDPNSEDVKSGRLKPWRAAHEIIDWSIPCPSIFDTSEQIMEKHGVRSVRPLADNTLRRVALGLQRYVINAEDPFFVTYGQHGGASRSGFDPLHTITASAKDQNQIVTPTLVNMANSKTTGRAPNTWDVRDPLRTITASSGFGVVAPSLVQVGYGEREGQAPRVLDLEKPLGTVVAGGSKHALVSAFLAQHNTGMIGRSAQAPLSTVTTRGTQQNIVAASMINMRGTSDAHLKGKDIRKPLSTVTAGGNHAGLVAAFMTKYYGASIGQSMTDPAHTVTTKDRMGLVIVNIQGEEYYIADIGMRMLTPREQFRAQGFSDSYVIDRGAKGEAIPKTHQTHKCGNSVCPKVGAAIIKINCPDLIVTKGEKHVG